MGNKQKLNDDIQKNKIKTIFISLIQISESKKIDRYRFFDYS